MIVASQPEARRAAVAAYIAANPTAGQLAISKATGIPRVTVRRLLSLLRAATQPVTGKVNAGITRTDEKSGFSLDTGATTEIKTLDQLLKVACVDLALWKVERQLVNKYSVATKNEETGAVTVTDLFQVKATLIPIAGQAEALALADILADLRTEAAQSIPKQAPRAALTGDKFSADPVLLEISPFDLHLGKLSWAAETGVPYDAKLSEEVFMQAVTNLWNMAQGFPVRRVVLVLGQDFFTADNSADTTTAGTPQHVDSRFAKNFRRGWRLMREAVEFLRARCPGGVDIIVVPGNHDTDTAFCAGEVLSALYEHTKDVRVDNGPSIRKYFRYGTNLIGFTHGDKEKHAQLPLLMANERPKDWSETTCREIHLGHLHHSRSTTFVSGSEHNSIRVRVLPSLSGADAWHHAHGYTAKRAAEAYLWGFKSGYIGHLSWGPVRAEVAA
jgi:hypothetical protein